MTFTVLPSNFMQCCMTSVAGKHSSRDIDVRTESNELPQQGDVFVTDISGATVAASATMY